MVTSNAKANVSVFRLGSECAGLNLLVAALAVAGSQVGSWIADADGAGVGLAAGLLVGLASHAFGSDALTNR